MLNCTSEKTERKENRSLRKEVKCLFSRSNETAFDVREMFRQVKNLKNNQRILLGLWERADSVLRNEIYEELKECDFQRNCKNQILFETIKFKMDLPFDRALVEELLLKTEMKFRSKILRVLETTRKKISYGRIGAFVLNYESSKDKSIFKMDGSILKRKYSEKNVNLQEILVKRFDLIDVDNSDERKSEEYKSPEEMQQKTLDKLHIQTVQDDSNVSFTIPSEIFVYENEFTRKICSYIRSGNYHQICYMLLRKIEESTGFEHIFYNEVLSLIYRIALIPGPFPQVCYFSTAKWDKSLIERQFYFSKVKVPVRDYKNYLSKFDVFESLISIKRPILLFYKKNGYLRLYDLLNDKTVKTNIEIDVIIQNLACILSRSREIIRRKVKSKQEIEKWWADRHFLDKQLEDLLNFEIDHVFGDSFFICLDEDLIYFPFEHTKSLRDKTVMRLPCTEFLNKSASIGSETIRKTAKAFENTPHSESIELVQNFSEKVVDIPDDFGGKLQPQIKSKLDDSNLETLKKESKDGSEVSDPCSSKKIDLKVIFGPGTEQTKPKITNFIAKHGLNNVESFTNIAYFGHGNGKKHLNEIKAERFFLFGCSSVRIIERHGFRKIGFPIDLLNSNVKTILGCLWDVTDIDIDTFGLVFLENLLAQESYQSAKSIALSKMRLKYLNGASIVCYSTVLF